MPMNQIELGETKPRAFLLPSALRKLLAVPEFGILVPLLAFTLLFYLLNASLLSVNNVHALLRAMAFVGVIAIGQTLLMVAGELDLSVGSVAGLCAIATGWLMKSAGWPIGAALVGGVGLGAMVGLINGLVAVKLGLPAFIATLGMLYIARGFNYLICAGYPIYPLPEAVKSFGSAEPLGLSWR